MTGRTFAQEEAIRVRTTQTRSLQDEIDTLLEATPPDPSEMWWMQQLAAAELALAQPRGPQEGATVHTATQTVEGFRENFQVQNVPDYGVRGRNTSHVAWAGVFNCGDTTPPTHSSRKAAVSPGGQDGVDFTFTDSKVYGAPIQGIAGGLKDTGSIRIERVHTKAVSGGNGIHSGDGVAGNKTARHAHAYVEDLFAEDDTGAGWWSDVRNWKDLHIVRGLYRRLRVGIYTELGSGALIENPTLVDCDEGFLQDADDVTIRGAALFNCKTPLAIRPGPRNGLARDVKTDIRESYIDLRHPEARYGLIRTIVNNGVCELVSDDNVFHGDPEAFLFRWQVGNRVRSLNFEEWQIETGNDHSSTWV